VLRISYLPDRTREDFLAEVEFIRYLADHGASVANVLQSQSGKLLEAVTVQDHTFFICLFEKATGKMLVENGYRYREGVPLSVYFYDCGKALGKIHQLAKLYAPLHRRYSFFDKYNAAYIDALIPSSLPRLKEKLRGLIEILQKTDQSPEVFGMVHFDFNDGNYNIDFTTGKITTYDFDNCCFAWYNIDLAGLWIHGVGWVQHEADPIKRKAFMDEYFAMVLSGYRSESDISEAAVSKLPLFIQASLMEGIVDAFEVMHNSGETPECDEALSYQIKCMEDDIPYMGFFDKIYSPQAPFEYIIRNLA
jgi:Ser/Thr protein kinase RdoA (MazF antagonist)